ncbi:MAG TPA: FAD-dependent thymidylate synthase [Bacteroidales bacterium]|jgi:thymidylate synthase (FAD)|nr:FAD-dependent thymidylate synthase [Bacteroidales bacterium]HQA87219.1 FAD-dependent thymidylate synthase [Bacteroidales bacterium]
MKIIEQTHQIIQKPNNPIQLIEQAGRTCYKSEDKITDDSAEIFAKKLVKLKHESVFEHVVVSVRFITNRGVTHELVRHRMCSFSQESTRYVKYNDMEFIRPVWWDKWTEKEQNIWIESMQNAEKAYLSLIKAGSTAEKAREVLPNSLKTEIVVTANLREWRHIFNLRCSKKAHPQVRQLMTNCCKEFKTFIPVLFNDIELHD